MLTKTTKISETTKNVNTSDAAKKIFIFYDGTWCGDNAETYTNIKRLAETVANQELNKEEIENGVEIPNGILIYYKGVGLNGKSILNYLVNGAISFEIIDDCIKVYKFIVDNYELDTEIWMFGLSRGAYIVRSVAGLINNCGILRKENRGEDEIREICEEFYKYYKNRDEDYRPDRMRARLRGMCHETKKPPIKFMGLIDCAGALGIPKLDMEKGLIHEFYDQNVSSEVENVYQALAIHDRLAAFTPCFVKRDKDKSKENDNGEYKGSRYANVEGVTYKEEDIWFPGAHYDVGDQYFTFGANFKIEEMDAEMDKITSKLMSILLKKNKDAGVISNVFDVINNNTALRVINFEIGAFVKEVLRHNLEIFKSIKIEPNADYANRVYRWMLEKMSEIDNNMQLEERARVPHEAPDSLRGDVYERLFDKFDFPYSKSLKKILLQDRVIKPWTPQEAVTQTPAPGYESKTLTTYNLINPELVAHVEIPAGQQ